jgi:hypothetical protein
MFSLEAHNFTLKDGAVDAFETLVTNFRITKKTAADFVHVFAYVALKQPHIKQSVKLTLKLCALFSVAQQRNSATPS